MNRKSRNEINMLEGGITGDLIRIALPMAAISILQQLFNAADVAVVGKFASSEAIAAVGANTAIINMFLTFFTGLSTGGNIAISHRMGMKDEKGVRDAVKTVFTLSLIGALVVIVLGQVIARPLLVLTNAPDNILDQAVLYLRIYLFAMMFAVVYNFASAILRSKGDTKRPLWCLIASGILNVILNLLFVIVFKLDVAGVAIATLISNIVCAGATFILLLKEEEPFRISLSDLKLVKEPLMETLRIGLPTGLQGLLFSGSNVIIQSAINSFGANCIAGNTAGSYFEFIAYFVVQSYGSTAATYMGQNFGAGNYDRCKKTFRRCMTLGFFMCMGVSFIFYFGHGFWLSLFTDDEGVLYYAMTRMTFVVLLEALTALNEMPASGLRAMGVSMTPTIISIMGSCVFRIIWINTVFRISHTITTLMLIYPVSWILLGIAQFIAYGIISRKKYAEKVVRPE